MRPECGYFYKSNEYGHGLEYYSKKWFSDVGNEIAVGERSSLYVHGDFLGVAQRIKKDLPNVKLIFCLRNPTERAYANYRFSVLSGFENRSFADSLKLEDRRFEMHTGWKKEIQPNLYRRRGEYIRQIEPFLSLFPRENMLFIKSEDMSANIPKTLEGVFRFLEVDDFTPEPIGSFGSSSVRSRNVQYVLRKIYGKKLDSLTENLRDGASETKSVLRFNLNNHKTPMDLESREILNQHYHSYNLKLESVLGWNVSDWK
jgi:hypothetical protein